MTVHATQVAHSGAPRTILRLPKVTHTTGLCRSSIYARIQRGTFPKPIKLGPKAVGWLASEVDTWLGRVRVLNVATGIAVPFPAVININIHVTRLNKAAAYHLICHRTHN